MAARYTTGRSLSELKSLKGQPSGESDCCGADAQQSDQAKRSLKRSGDELLPCPFCGGDARLLDKGGDEYDVCCGTTQCYASCGADWYLERARAIEAWNRRAMATRQ